MPNGSTGDALTSVVSVETPRREADASQKRNRNPRGPSKRILCHGACAGGPLRKRSGPVTESGIKEEPAARSKHGLKGSVRIIPVA
jgi:hypothetical protein